MKFKKSDAHILRILLNQSTHAMAIAMYGDRAKKIMTYIKRVTHSNDYFEDTSFNLCWLICSDKKNANFLLDNDLININQIVDSDLSFLFKTSIAEKLWDSGKLDPHLDRINGRGISEILTDSPIAEKVWDSGKLDPYLNKMNPREKETLFPTQK